VLEGVPKDKYYLYGKIELWIDDKHLAGRVEPEVLVAGRAAERLRGVGFATADFNDKERWWGSTFGLQLSENIKADRATASGMNGPGNDPANDRRIPLGPGVLRLPVAEPVREVAAATT
jgi:hypothetical protein